MKAESYGDEYYTRSPNVIRQSKKLSASAKLVYQSLLYFAADKLECFPKEETIAQDTGLTAKTVRGAIGELVAHKLISQERMEHLRGKPKGYRLHIIPAEFTGSEAIRLPAMLADERTARQATKEQRQEERPAQAPNQQRSARKPKPLDHQAIKAFKDVTGYYPSPDKEGLREAIIETVDDLDRWRRVLERNKDKPWITQSMDILRVYREDEPQEATTNGGFYCEGNEIWARQIAKREGRLVEGVKPQAQMSRAEALSQIVNQGGDEWAALLAERRAAQEQAREEGVSSDTAPPRAARIPVKSEIPTGATAGLSVKGRRLLSIRDQS